MIGTKISHYEILRKLGEGGMGEVYLARDADLGRNVAIKLLPDRLAANREALERLQREARAAAALQHPNIVTIHEILHHGNVHCIVMAYIEGDLLSGTLARGALSTSRAIEISLTLCDALAQAHAAGIVHRDLKPGNIIVDRRGQPHVLDFGLAIDGDSTRLTQAGATVGTPNYMSPEQARGNDVDARTDIFSLGAILYEMITTKRAFVGDNALAVCRQIVEVDPQPLSRYSSEASPELERIVATALAKDRELRYQTMSGLAAALRGLETPRQAARPARKANPRSIGIAAAAAVLLAVVAAAWIGLSGRRGTARDASRVGQIRSLAVLPLEGRTADPEQSYFADGMTDALIDELGRISALNVVGRGSTFEYRASTLPRPQIAAALRADALIEGSVLLAGDRVRINVELVLADGDRLWGDSYEGEIGDVFVLQADVAREIARQVRVNLAPFEETRFRRAHAVDPDALRAHLRGQYYANLETLEGVNEALEHFERAVSYDPSYAEAYVSLAETYFNRGYYSPTSSSDWAKADSFALQALERDEDLEGAHLVLAQIRLLRDWDLPAARLAIERARDINPTRPTCAPCGAR